MVISALSTHTVEFYVKKTELFYICNVYMDWSNRRISYFKEDLRGQLQESELFS